MNSVLISGFSKSILAAVNNEMLLLLTPGLDSGFQEDSVYLKALGSCAAKKAWEFLSLSARTELWL